MVNDLHEIKEHNYKMDQNYWYPYPVFSLYAIRLYRKIKAACESMGLQLDDNYRYVYVETFLNLICDTNQDYINTMLGGDEDE